MPRGGEGRPRYTREQYILQLQATHPLLKPVGEYLGSKVKIPHYCQGHNGTFEAAPAMVLRVPTASNRRGGCPHCKPCRHEPKRLGAAEVQRRLDLHHKGRIQITSEYTTINERVSFSCDQGHEWVTFLSSVLVGHGCPRCNGPVRHSQMALDWIQGVSTRLKCSFQHAGNTGEVTLYGESGRKYFADGFNEKRSLVLEFNGDNWHGNPARYKPRSRPHPWSKLTAAQLHRNTRAKALDLAAAGYKVISVWQSDWQRGRLASTIDKPGAVA